MYDLRERSSKSGRDYLIVQCGSEYSFLIMCLTLSFNMHNMDITLSSLNMH